VTSEAVTTSAKDAIASAVLEGLISARIERVFYVPDTVFARLIPRLLEQRLLRAYGCSREDEGVAAAAGSFLAGKLAAVVMEGSGIGYSGLILARAQLQRTPMLLVASHTLGVGEPYDYHGATRVVGEGVLKGIGIPYRIVGNLAEISDVIRLAAVTARGQKTIVGVLIPPFVASLPDGGNEVRQVGK
jgi:sulfopyruvate decarboxylase subunit alpha